MLFNHCHLHAHTPKTVKQQLPADSFCTVNKAESNDTNKGAALTE